MALVDDKVVGMYVWYVRYSTWKGKGLYLEDIIVTETMRGQGIGDALFKACIQDAKAIGAHFHDLASVGLERTGHPFLQNITVRLMGGG